MGDSVTIKLSPADRERLNALSRQTDRTQASVIRWLLRHARVEGLPDLAVDAPSRPETVDHGDERSA